MTQLLLGFKEIGLEPGERFASLSSTELTRLPQADTVGVYLDRLPDSEDATGVRKLDFRDMFRRRTRVILFAGPGAAKGLGTPLGSWLRARLNFNHSALGQHEILSRTRQLVWYFENQLAYALFLSDEPDATPLADAIDATKTSIGIAALRLRHELADIWIVPLTSRELLEDAARLMAEVSNVVPYPGYLDELQIVDETALATELREHQRQAKELEEQIDQARHLKRILYLSDLELQHGVVQFLGDYLSVAARDIEGVKEDFRLGPRDGSADWCIGEVKGMGRANVARRHVADLVSHRSDAGLADDFPGLLVANTFHRAQTVAERDVPIDGEVARWAAEAHIMITRTFDLVLLKKLSLRDASAIDNFTEAIRLGGGWFEMGQDLSTKVHVG